MSSKREEERNEKIIRGLIKLPPNRRCINCNSLGPQYVCTNFWTFICTTCSGIHREFTHRVKSVSMAKFTFQEVDALQKGGNQRARELYLKAWDFHRNRLPDNSNIDKLRDFIKNVYVDKKYSLENSAYRPPRDPQSLRSHEDETRRASSYHSYSQSPPYDFQYEERQYGKPAHSLTRNPDSNRGLYEGKLAGFLSLARLSDYTNDGRCANEGSYPRRSDFSGSGGSDPFRSDVLSPRYQRDIGSPFSETSRDISREVPPLHKSDTSSSKFHSQRTSSGSFGSFDSSSLSFKSVHSFSFAEDGFDLGYSADNSHYNSAPVPSLAPSSVSKTFNGLDLFSAPFVPENVTSALPTVSNSQLQESISTQSANVIQQSPVSSIPHFSEQQVSKTLQPSPLDSFISPSDEQSSASNNEKASESGVVMPNDGGWATFDMPQNIVPMGTKNSSPAAVTSSGESARGTLNPFSNDISSYQDSAGHEPSASTFSFGPESLKIDESTITGTHLWNAFDSADGHPTPTFVQINEQATASDAEKSLGDARYKYSSNYGSATTPNESEPPSSSLSSHFNMAPSDFPIGSEVAAVHLFETDHKSTNPFDLPNDSDMESTTMPQFWNMSSLQEALPNLQMSASYTGQLDQSWFTQNSVASFIPGGVLFDSPSGSLELMSGQAPNSSLSSIHTPAPVASVGGNPFA